MKFYYKEDTIAALSTPLGEGGIAVIRISGPDALSAAKSLYKPISGKETEWLHYTMHYGHVVSPTTGEVIDEAIFLVMKAPHSYTCEDCAEIQCHGGMTAVSKILDLLKRVGVRSAMPGEFTRRAFLNGRIDLLQAEAVMDIITARDENALLNAEKQLSGKYSNELSGFRDDIIAIIARIEAPLEYPEEDLFDTSVDDIIDSISSLYNKSLIMEELCREGKVRKDGFKIAIAGKPNVGKSSILNMLLCEERAIVTDIAGTTRDTIEECCILGGASVSLCDTAGVRKTSDEIEKIGVDRTRNALSNSDFILLVLDLSRPFDEEDEQVIELLEHYDKKYAVILNKSDEPHILEESRLDYLKSEGFFYLSTKTSEGRESLKGFLADKIRFMERTASDSYFLSSRRHLDLLGELVSALSYSLETVRDGHPLDMILVGLREALDVLARICGESFDEAVLDKIFSEFCVGK